MFTKDQNHFLTKAVPEYLFIRHLVDGAAMYNDRDPEQDSAIKTKFLAKAPIRHETLSEFQPLRLFPHLRSRDKDTNST